MVSAHHSRRRERESFFQIKRENNLARRKKNFFSSSLLSGEQRERERERERESRTTTRVVRIKEGEKTRRENPRRVFFFSVFLRVVSATRERAIVDSSFLGKKGEVGKQRSKKSDVRATGKDTRVLLRLRRAGRIERCRRGFRRGVIRCETTKGEERGKNG